ncbi:MAG: tRNA (N6-threonylcarbamoyladenosine(37)-N6)-methyltransferase TrmO [Clostridia bacterium]|nr:tRNA (N6-threonylcarbamoyladenosine(37)-N6)-methyltransferase TrmO [Clostridia bacterium]MBQ2433551.1 tRNA (N6-threonylcarbamoyladenosine(37)-N6)-methyltransferase TrmO [Clostridia bacterium]MBQ5769905.1 tRNA (N6-threonylcarbamoyladenosine(37)-N6)-methyltransferase TrmO [Clostridia bacterium]
MQNLKRIARLKCDFPTKFGLPRQSGLNESLTGKIIFEREYRNPDAVRGIEEFSHLWLIWGFDIPQREGYSATVRPPRLGGNERVGVFATRSPFRPNPLGLTVVKLDKVEIDPALGPVLTVSGFDMMDGTEIFDIKPYIPYADMRPDATGSFAEENKGYRLTVEDPENLLSVFPQDKRLSLVKTLALDPRPAYHDDPNRVYGFAYAGCDVRFTVNGTILTVVKIVRP